MRGTRFDLDGFGFMGLGFLVGWWVHECGLVVECDGATGGIEVGLGCHRELGLDFLVGWVWVLQGIVFGFVGFDF